MAANTNSFIRVRLYFDYPPPAVIDCRMCWLLVDLNKCRVVADLESIIREKFEFSPRSILNLFIEDCYLPHTERIFVVRDNDSVRVKVDSEAQVNGHVSENCRKRQRPTEADGPGGDGVSVEWKEKKRKKQSKESLQEVAKLASCDERSKKSQEKQTKKKKKKKAEEPSKPAATTKKTTTAVKEPVKNSKKVSAAPVKAHSVSSSESSSSSSEEDVAPKKSSAQKPANKTPVSTPATSKTPPKTKPTQRLSHPTSSSSSETDSSSDEAPDVKSRQKNKPLASTSPNSTLNSKSNCQQASSDQHSTNHGKKQETSTATSHNDRSPERHDSDGEEIKLVIHNRRQQPHFGMSSQPSWRGGSSSMRGPKRGGPREKARGGGRGFIRWQADGTEFSSKGAKEPSYHTDSLTNTSVVIQNGAERAPVKDYSTMPLLAAPPQLGQTIAFKLLELGENYTPEISDYKEGKIVSFDPTTKQIELELLHVSQAPVEPGKFDLVYQNPDGSERVEYALSRGAWVTERWDSLLEPRLLI